MNVNNNRVEYIAPTGVLLAEFLGDDNLRAPIKFELEEINHELQKSRYIDEPPCVELISKWHDKFLEVITKRDPNNYPDLKVVKDEFIELLINILVPELLGDKPVYIVQFMVAKLRDQNSVFYSEIFDEEAFRIIAQGKKIVKDNKGIPKEFLDQLRQREAKKAMELEKEAAGMGKMEALRAKVREVKLRNEALKANMDRVGRENLEKGKRINDDAKKLNQEFIEKNALMIAQANELREGAEEVKGHIPLLKEQVKLTDEEIQRLKQANVQLQNDVNQLRKDIEDKKDGWLSQVVCIVASVVLSCIFKKPVIITPNGGSVG